MGEGVVRSAEGPAVVWMARKKQAKSKHGQSNTRNQKRETVADAGSVVPPSTSVG